jgi:hypothetical protein
MKTSYRRPRMYTVGAIVAIGVIVPILVASALLFGLQLSPVTATQASTTPSKTANSATNSTAVMPGPCAGASPYRSGPDSPPSHGDNASLSFPIFAMPTFETAEVCVVYADSNPTFNATMDLTKAAVVGSFGTHVYPNGTVKHPFVPAPGITVTPNETKIALGGSGPTKAFVAFTISSTNGTKGLYFLNIAGLAPEACNNEFRFAVGYSFTASNETGPYFPIPAGFSSCSPSGGTLSSVVYAVVHLAITPLSCATITCDLNETS